jgi:hypothetical protein
VVQVFDITPLFPSPEYYAIQDDLFFGWAGYEGDDPNDPNLTLQISDDFGIPHIGLHYFIGDDKGGIAPVWDFRDTLGPNAVIVAAVTADLPEPFPDVDWLSLDNVSGDLADFVLRLYAVGGDPPPIVSILRSSW